MAPGWIRDHGTGVQVDGCVRQTSDQMWEVGERKENNQFQVCKPRRQKISMTHWEWQKEQCV